MASNICAEQFCVGGEIWLGVFVLAVLAVIRFTNSYILTALSKNYYTSAALLAIISVPAIFYMHRNELVYQLKQMRDSALIAVLFFIFGFLQDELRSTRFVKCQKLNSARNVLKITQAKDSA